MNQCLEGRELFWLTVGLSLVVFMQVLDSTIANVALPTISGNLGVSISQGVWVITSFGVANAISIPLTGFLAKRIGEVRLFLISTFLFVLASWLCGLASSLGLLVFFRAFQGLVSGPMIPLSQSLLLTCYPPAKHGLALALWAMVIVTAPILGPILGGYISENYAWGWIFFLNLPVGIVALAICWHYLKNRENITDKGPVDWMGIGLMVVGVASFQLMLDRGRDLGWFESMEILVLAAISFLALIYFLLWEKDEPHPVVELSLFRYSNFSIGTLISCLAFIIYLGNSVLLPQLLQTQLGYTSITAGLAVAPIAFFPILLAPIVGKFASKLDMRILITISFLIFALTFYWRSLFNAQVTFQSVFWPQLVQGIGVALFFMPLTTIVFSQLKPDMIAQASSLSSFLRTLSGAVGASLTINLWERREAFYHQRLTEYFTLDRSNTIDWLHQTTHLGLPKHAAYALAERLITQQAYIAASNEIFYVSAIIFVCLTGVIWLSKRV
ncbi:MAG: DHA2 family efflux MFS transporter permease subunit [Neisseriaceae bacterium]